MTEKLFFGTYALIEIYKSNPKYNLYREGFKVLLNKLNLYEFSYFLIKENREKECKEIFNKYSRFNVDYDEDALIEAAKMKFKFLKERLSFVDCIGYVIAKRNNAKFLTGDGRFRGKEKVLFVK